MRWAAALVLLAASASTAPEAPRVQVVVIEGMAFRPASISVREGHVVRFENRDFVEHTATASDGAFDSGRLKEGERFQWVAKGKGIHPYVCALHPTMKGTLEVK